MKVRSMFAGAVCVSLVLSAAIGLAEGPKIAFFDLQKFIANSGKAREAQKRLQEFVETKRGDLEKNKRSLMTLGEDIQRKSSMLKEEKRIELMKEFEIKKMELQISEQEAQKSVQSQEREYMEALERDVRKIIGKLRTERGLDLVVNSMALISADDNLDVTEEVVKIYDADADLGGKKPAGASKPAPPAGGPKPKPAGDKKP